MIKVVEVRKEHFDEVYPLLRGLNSSPEAKANWKKTFDNPFGAPEGNVGFMLKDDDRVAGFLGCIYSRRTINGRDIKFCNTHSWIVDPAYKNKGLLLLNRVHKLKDYVLTNFSASEGPFVIMKKLGWKEKPNKASIVLLNPIKRLFGSKSMISHAEDRILPRLDKYESDIYHTHKTCHNTFVNFVANGNRHSLQVFRKVAYHPGILRKFLPFVSWSFMLGRLYYVSDPDFFFHDFHANFTAICKEHGLTGMIIQDEHLKKYGIKPNRPYKTQRPLLYRDHVPVGGDDIDLLYSEIFTLDLN